MKTATARDLRQRTAALLADVRRGEEILITRRKKPIALLVPAERILEKPLNPVAFGIWRSRPDLRRVEGWVRKIRAPRFHRSRTTPTS
jgi:prevent-host-death family protein